MGVSRVGKEYRDAENEPNSLKEMPTSKQKEELKSRYLSELLKIGFNEKQAAEIVAEAADRLGTALDPPKQEMGPIYSFHKPQPKPVPAQRQTQPMQRAVKVIMRKEHQLSPARVTWNVLKRERARPTLGKSFMEAMQEQMAAEMKRLEFSQEDIEYILGETH